MADMTDPILVRFSNEGYRPLAEALQGMTIFADALKVRHVQAVAPILAGHVDADPLVDGRAAQGVQGVTKKDITDLAAVIVAVLNATQAPGVPELLDKFSVRAPRVSLDL